jgi:oligopeptide transport system ATP-binding protein
MANGNENIKLSVKDLTVSFRTNQGFVRAVRGVSFDLAEGETLAIVGESGSGKSVSSRAIMGILAGNAIVDKGSIIYENQDLTKISEENFHKIRGGKIGMIFQDPMSSLNPIMKIGKQITEGMIINGKRLKNRYKDLIHETRMEFANAKAIKKELKYHFKYDVAQLKEEGKESEIPALKEKLDKELKLQDEKIAKAKVKMKEEAPKAKAQVKQEWENEKARINKLIEPLRKDLAQAQGAEKQKIRHEISELKEQLARFKKVTKREAKERAIEVMGEVGIPQPEKRLKQYPFQFSGGMRQRIVIAIALTLNPDVLICDEPTTALDVTIQAQILELIKKLKEERNLSVIFITHDLGVVANMADRVAVMYAGKIVEIGLVNEIFYSPKHPYTWALLSSMPDLNSKDRLTAIPGTPPNMLFPPKGDAFADRSQYAMKIDFEEEPPFFKITDTHYAATWLLHKDAPKIEVPKVIKERINAMMASAVKEVKN